MARSDLDPRLTLVLASLLAGCGGSDRFASFRTAARPVLETSGAGVSEPRWVADLGIVLGRGQTIEHIFRLDNPSDRAVKILGAEARTPCCSAVGSVPPVIPARGSAELNVRFTPGGQTGPRQVEFLVATDDPAAPVLTCVLRVRLYPEVEFRALPGSDTFLRLGQPGRQRLRVVCRRAGDAGRDSPTSLSAPGVGCAAFDGPPRTLPMGDDGLTTTERDLTIELPSSAEEGTRTVPLVLSWADGRTQEHLVRWTVTPHLVAAPAALVIPRDDRVPRAILIRSETAPFRILSVEGADFAPAARGTSPVDTPAPVHRIRIVLPEVAGDLPGPTDVRIRTDHPDQSVVLVTVVRTGEPTR
jgi:hypothetical protein